MTQRSNEELVTEINACRVVLREWTDAVQRMEAELIHRLEADHARAVDHPFFRCVLEYPTPKYDHEKLRVALGELVSPGALAGAWLPEEVVTTIVPGHFHGARLNALAQSYGDRVRDALLAARLPSAPPRIKITPREATE